MKNSKRYGTPIYFFTKMNYMDSDDEDMDLEGDIRDNEQEIHYSFIHLKTGEEFNGVAFHNVLLSPANIPHVKDSINITQDGVGSYSIDDKISLEECLQTLQKMLQDGVSAMDITADDIKNGLKKEKSRAM